MKEATVIFLVMLVALAIQAKDAEEVKKVMDSYRYRDGIK